jgi:DNA-binding FadR family transcriptional regulator
MPLQSPREVIPRAARSNRFELANGQVLGAPVARVRLADYVFQQLARSIVSGVVRPGSVLPPRELCAQFGVSAKVLRQATRRLEALALVRRQPGRPTTVLDPSTASGLQRLQLRLALASPGDCLALAAREALALSMLPTLTLEQRRTKNAELRRLEALVDAMPESQSPDEILRFRLRLARHISVAARHSAVEHQVRWWVAMLQDLETRSHLARPLRQVSKARYRMLIQMLRGRRGAPEYRLKFIDELLDWSEAHPPQVNGARGHVRPT